MPLFGPSTIAVFVIVGVLTLLLGSRKPFWVLAFLILALPLRDFTTRLMFTRTDWSLEVITSIGRWWFVVILGLGIVEGARLLTAWRQNPYRPAFITADGILLLILALGVVDVLLSPNRLAGLTSFRGYVQPLLVYPLARLIRPTRRELRIFLMLALMLGILMAGFGLIQGLTWSEEDYISRGYIRQNGELVTPPIEVNGQRYIRPASFVSGPNELGVDMDILFFGALGAVFFLGKKRRLPLALAAMLFFAGLIATFSRSAFLGWVAGLIGFAFILLPEHRADWQRSLSRHRWKAMGVFFALVTVVIVVVVQTGFSGFLRDTIVRLQSEYHYIDSMQAARFLVSNPAGVGMGMVEPKGALVLQSMEGTYHVEGSIFQIAMEMGVWGLLLWVLFWALAFKRILRQWRAVAQPEVRVLVATAITGWLAALVSFLFLPLMQSISLMVWLWFLMGASIDVGMQYEKWAQ